MRGYYSKELAKINKSRKSGAGSDEVYSSSWIHFKSLDTFLKTQIVPRGSQSNLDSFTMDDDEDIDGESMDNVSETSQDENKQGPVKKRSRLNGPEAVMSQAMSCLQDIRKRSELRPTPVTTLDEDAHYGNYIAGALRKMDDRTKSFVKLKFQTILYEAQYGALQGQGQGPMNLMPQHQGPYQTPYHMSQPVGQQSVSPPMSHQMSSGQHYVDL